MNRNLKQRIAITLVATLIGLVCGAVGGFYLSRAVTLKLTEAELVELSKRNIIEADRASREARVVLTDINTSPYPFCSDAEVTYLHDLVFQSEYLKEAGRIQDGKIICSANLGKLRNPIQLQNMSFSQPDGINVYRDFAPLHMGNLTVVALQKGHSYVIINPYLETHRAFPPAHYTSTGVYNPAWQSIRLAAAFPQATRALLTANGNGRAGDVLYSTECSPHYYACVTDYISAADAVHWHRDEFDGQIAFYTLIGGTLGLLLSLLYRHNRSMAQQLRRAIRRDQLRVVYQPIVRIADRRIVGVEALLRWTDEEGYAVPPNVFVKLAEERGFVGEITRLVTRKALADLRKPLQRRPDFRLSINVAAADLSDSAFLPMLQHALEKAHVLARSLAIEITESCTAQDKMALETLLRLHQMGIAVHIDDFGTGYSSLSYLHDLSVDCLKVDKTFTHAIGTESVTATILPQILSMAHALNLEVVVEGIETESQADYFAGQNPPVLAQGWLFGYPMTADEFQRRLAVDDEKNKISSSAAFAAS